MLVRTRFGIQNHRVTESVDSASVEAKRQTRKAWMFLLATLIVILGVGVILFLRDDPPPEDSWMMPERTVGGGPDNPLAVFCRELEKPEIVAEMGSIFDLNKKSSRTTDSLRAVISQNDRVIALWDQLVATDSTEWRWPVAEEAYLPSIIPLGGHLTKARIEMALGGEKLDEAITLFEHALLFGVGLRKAEGLLIHHAVSSTVDAITLSFIEDIAMSPTIQSGDLLRLQSYLRASDPVSCKELKLVMQMEYESFKNRADEELRKRLKFIYNQNNADVSDLFITLYYKKNKTAKLVLDGRSKIFNLLEKSDADFIQASRRLVAEYDSLVKDKPRLFINPNAFGILALAKTYKIEHGIHLRSVTCIALHRLNELMLALRRYELEHKSLPAQLSALVPAFIDSIPLDPFDNKPLRWNSKTQRLYSVGEDGVDDGGKITEPGTPDVDTGYFYWWGEVAKNHREKGSR